MANPQLIEQKPLSLVEVKSILEKVENRDKELNYLSNKVKDYLAAFVTLTPEKKEKLAQKLLELNLTRLKEEYLIKIVDFLPTTVDELKIVLQAYPLSLPKKDQESIIGVVSEFVKKQ